MVSFKATRTVENTVIHWYEVLTGEEWESQEHAQSHLAILSVIRGHLDPDGQAQAKESEE